MMLCNIPVRRTAPQGWPAHDPTRETPSEALAEEGAEGATAPETLRQKDRDRVMNFWKVRPLENGFHRRGNPAPFFFAKKGFGEISQVP
jgi:hypothetical protein